MIDRARMRQLAEVISKVDGGYVIFSRGGKKLSRVYRSKADAIKRLRQIEYFKNNS